jgi:TadE-like protein
MFDMKQILPDMIHKFILRLKQDEKGVAIIEFAYSLPLLMAIGFGGAETAMFVQTNQKVSQVSLAVADNVSRLGEVGILQTKRVYEADLVDIMDGAKRQLVGEEFDTNARVIVSSVEWSEAGNPYIHWQRCGGSLAYPSSYGIEGDGLNDTRYANGFGPTGRKVKPVPDSALIFVEMAYDYNSLFPIAPFKGQRIVKTASVNVRDNRDLTRIYDRTGDDEVAECS